MRSIFDTDESEQPGAYEKMGSGPEGKGPKDDVDSSGPHDGHRAAARELAKCYDERDHDGMAKALYHFVKMSK